MDRGGVIADTDVLLDALAGRGAHALVTSLLRSERLATSAVTAFEIWRGADSDAKREAARELLRGLRIYPLNTPAARRAAEVHQALKANPIGERDTFIAGICLAVNRAVLTANVRHFKRVPGLEVVQAR